MSRYITLYGIHLTHDT